MGIFPTNFRKYLKKLPDDLHIELAQRTFHDGRQGMRTVAPRTLKTLQVLPPNVHAHFIFRFENGPGNQSLFFYP